MVGGVHVRHEATKDVSHNHLVRVRGELFFEWLVFLQAF